MPLPILDHGAIGNGRVIALVSNTASIDWLCMPRFDSPAVFARLLDEEKGGSFGFRFEGSDSTNGERVGRLAYLRNTNVLRTEIATGNGAALEILDFAPRRMRGVTADCPPEIVRLVRPLSGAPRLAVKFDPKPDFGIARVELHPDGPGLRIEGGATSFGLATNVPIDYVTSGRTFSLHEPAFFVFRCGKPGPTPSLGEIECLWEDTVGGWRHWVKTLALPNFALEAVLRSALCLKLHAYEDTGAIIAAATTSIPEALDTERCWDYRFCWLRDSAFVIEALRRLGHLTEGERFLTFLRDVAESGPLIPLYGLGGERDLTEHTLEHLAGFAGNGHVRIGNAAFEQVQNDVYGELILCLETLLRDPRLVREDGLTYLPLVERVVEEAILAAPKADTSIWEFRAIPRQYTFSRAMCWVAMERGSRLARHLGRFDLQDRWSRIAAHEREVVLAQGYSEASGFFTQSFDADEPDAANLLLPTIGLIDGADPRFLSTLDAYREKLARGGYMLRYVNPDDFGETTSAFSICSFWWAEALALAGRLEEAIEVFRHVARHANPLGLFSEDIEPETGRLLGNFPQAYTHVGLINAAMTIGGLIDAREGHIRAWR